MNQLIQKLKLFIFLTLITVKRPHCRHNINKTPSTKFFCYFYAPHSL